MAGGKIEIHFLLLPEGHDPDTLAEVDRVIYLEDGHVAGVGTHPELQASSASYRALFSEGAPREGLEVR